MGTSLPTMGQTIYDSTRVNTRVTAMRTVNNIGKILVIVAGILAIVHLVYLRAERPKRASGSGESGAGADGVSGNAWGKRNRSAFACRSASSRP